jgi:hypothetical protein
MQLVPLQSGFTQYVGRKTTHRFINHNDGLAVCCRGVLAEKRGLASKSERQHPRQALYNRPQLYKLFC